MQRVCFTLKLRAETLPEYIERHQNVWPEMREALRSTGWTNYSLFVGPGPMLVGYVEVEDFEKAIEGMKLLPVNDRWQMEMLPFFDSSAKADDAMKPLLEVFHLD